MIDDLNSSDEVESLWMTISEVAERKAVSRASVSERVLRLEERGLITTRPGRGRTKLVNIAEYDRVVGQVGDLGRKLGADTRRGGEDGDEPALTAGGAYTRAQAQRTVYLAEIARLDLEERRGELVKAVKLRPVIEAAGRAVAAAIEGFSENLDALRAAALDEDHTVFNRAVRNEIRRVRADVVKAVQGAMPSARPPGEGAPGAE